MHAMIRRYRVRLGTVEQAARHAERGFLPLLRQIPGFVSCQLVDAGNDILTCMALFETPRSEEHTSELQSRLHLVCRLLLEKKKPPSVSTRPTAPCGRPPA